MTVNESIIILFIICVFPILLIAHTVRTVPSHQKWIVERLGKYYDTWMPGIHFRIPFIDRVSRKLPLSEQTSEELQASNASQIPHTSQTYDNTASHGSGEDYLQKHDCSF